MVVVVVGVVGVVMGEQKKNCDVVVVVVVVGGVVMGENCDVVVVVVVVGVVGVVMGEKKKNCDVVVVVVVVGVSKAQGAAEEQIRWSYNSLLFLVRLCDSISS